MAEQDRDYLLARARQERELAASATDSRVQATHLTLAHEYEVRANLLDLVSKAANDGNAIPTSALSEHDQGTV
jgi:hypothetical protein